MAEQVDIGMGGGIWNVSHILEDDRENVSKVIFCYMYHRHDGGHICRNRATVECEHDAYSAPLYFCDECYETVKRGCDTDDCEALFFMPPTK